jgi:hypothetical protein
MDQLDRTSRRGQRLTRRECDQASSRTAGGSVMPFKVLLTNDAARDLDELYDYIALHDAPRKVDYILEQIEKAFSNGPNSQSGVLTPRNCWRLGFVNIARFFSNLIVSFTGLWIRTSMFC